MTLINLTQGICVHGKADGVRHTYIKAFLGRMIQETEEFEQWRIEEVVSGQEVNDNGQAIALQYDHQRKLTAVVDIRKSLIASSQGVA